MKAFFNECAYSLQSCPILCNQNGPWPARLLCPWDSPGKNNRVGCHFLLKIFNEKSLIIEENNKRGKTRDVFRKTGNIKGTFCQKMSPIKDKNGRDLVEAEEIKKRWKDYTEALYNKNLN